MFRRLINYLFIETAPTPICPDNGYKTMEQVYYFYFFPADTLIHTQVFDHSRDAAKMAQDLANRHLCQVTYTTVGTCKQTGVAHPNRPSDA